MKKTFLIGSLIGLFFMLFLATTVSAVAPTITAHATSPSTVYTNTDFKFNMTATDPENATFTGYVQFYVNGLAKGPFQQQTVLNDTNKLIGTLLSSDFIKGDKLVAEYWAGDGEYNTTPKVNTTAVEVNIELMLEISKLYVYVDGDKDSVDDGDTIEDVKPDSKVKFEFKIENLYDEDDEDELGIDKNDMEIENIEITVTIREIDDDGDDDLEEEIEFDLDAGDEESKSVEFDIPMDVDEDDYDVEITIEGEDGDGNDHTITWDLTLEVEKEKHDMKLERAEFDQSTLSCDRETGLNVKLVNFGRSDEDDIILTVENAALGINIKEKDIEIDEGDDWSRSYTIIVADNIASGTYKVNLKTYYDEDDYEDNDYEADASGSINLVISKCAVTIPTEEEEEEEEEEEVIVIEPTDSEEGEEGEVGEAPTGGEVTREISFQDTSLYLVLLVATVVILGLILLVMFFKLIAK